MAIARKTSPPHKPISIERRPTKSVLIWISTAMTHSQEKIWSQSSSATPPKPIGKSPSHSNRDQIFSCECVIAVEIQMSTDFVGLRSIEIGLCGGDVFLAIAILLHLIFGFCFGREGSGFRDLFGPVAAPGFFRVRPGLLERSLQLLVVEGDQDLARLDGIALADQDLVEAAADLGTNANVAGV